MLDMGFLPDVKKISKKLAKKRQSLFFSATFSDEVLDEADYLLTNPVKLEAQKANSAASKIEHIVHPVDGDKKAALLSYLIGSSNKKQVIVFTRTKRACDELSKEIMKDGIRNMVIHSDRTQAYRAKALNHFKEGKVQALIATDIASRGIDIDKLPMVINYELPNIAEDYVHRVGRTGRAGETGLAISFITDNELYRLHQVEELLDVELEQKVVEGFEPVKFKAELLTRKSREARKDKIARNRKRRHSSQGNKSGSNKKRSSSVKKKSTRKGPLNKQGAKKPSSKSSRQNVRKKKTGSRRRTK